MLPGVVFPGGVKIRNGSGVCNMDMECPIFALSINYFDLSALSSDPGRVTHKNCE